MIVPGEPGRAWCTWATSHYRRKKPEVKMAMVMMDAGMEMLMAEMNGWMDDDDEYIDEGNEHEDENKDDGDEYNDDAFLVARSKFLHVQSAPANRKSRYLMCLATPR